ncbi:cytochrome c nitrite reductase pentaheme subunit [Mergibacter septicus]|uniref:Cytochrome c nitrite reductase pentaheme subunit n=1 Tax=Mergibacter septicus TaxID=221402 RepID=A0A8D4J343_9PAST|nr:cytochrome c nitrite reductase pentaheme subunit [Mergibacter septicus]AWX16005.1 cytochrome c nitrite reductase pentaheme subunit [Mergibacter septicus]QDJ15258.1 cytochrome c nitrite reductase pentaheme subunit [Mergibacter septicus]UTU47325.1 cytochrome c nitrite reductase pentaheme subunit [Mergibacter septicus]WMR95498.1 cytochrome c nitrite reductase pentaheme subunit [Mergibacter septicus]
MRLPSFYYRNILALSWALLGILLLATHVQAFPDMINDENTLTYQPKLEHQRDPNHYCAKCHKFNNQQFHGIHLSKTNPNTGKRINCVSCHGHISENHRRGVKDVMRFHSDIFSNKKPLFTVQEQNQICFSCHNPDQLRQKFWVHDVHAVKLSCANCHTLHSAQDRMKQLNEKQRIKLCVNCHSKLQQLQNLKTEKPLQKDK